VWRCAVAGLTLGGEHTTLSTSSLWLLDIRRETGGRPNSTVSIPVGVAEKELVVDLWTLCKKVFSQGIVPALGGNRSGP